MKEPETLAEKADYESFVASMAYIFERIADEEDIYCPDENTPQQNAEQWKMLKELMNDFFGTSTAMTRISEKSKKAVYKEYAFLIALARIGWEECYELKSSLPWETFHAQLLQIYRSKMDLYHIMKDKNDALQSLDLLCGDLSEFFELPLNYSLVNFLTKGRAVLSEGKTVNGWNKIFKLLRLSVTE